MIKTFTQTLAKHLPTLLLGSLFIFLILFFLEPSSAFADNIGEGVNKAKNLSEVVGGQSETMKKIAEWSSILVSIFTPLIAVILKLVSSLMTDSYIFGNNSSGGYDIAQLLYEVWDISRSIVNYLLLAVIMFSAFMGMIPKFGEQYALDKKIGQIILAAIMVNLTWFGVRVVMDASEVATHAVYSLPQTIFGANQKYQDAMDMNNPNNKCQMTDSTIKDSEGKDKSFVEQKGNCYPVFSIINPKGNFDEPNKKADASQVESVKKTAIENFDNQIQAAKKQMGEHPAEQEKYQSIISSLEKQKEDVSKLTATNIVNYGAITIFWDDFNYERFNSGTIAPLFAYSIMQIQKLPMIASQSSDLQSKMNATNNNIIDNGWISLLINSVIALVVMIIVLVVFVMMLIVLIFRIIVIWVNIMALPFWVFSKVGIWGGIFDKIKGKYVGVDPLVKSIFAPAIMGFPMVIGFILIQAGTVYNLFPDLNNGIMLTGPLINGVASLHQVFYYALCIAVMWMGSKAAISSVSEGTFFDGIIKQISGGVDGLVKGIASAPQYMQWIPIMGSDGKLKGKASFDNLLGSQGIGSVASYFQQTSNANNPFAPQTLEAAEKKAVTNEEVFDAHLQYAKSADGNPINKETIHTELENQKSQLETLFKSSKTKEQIETEIKAIASMPETKKAFEANAVTLERIWKQLNIPSNGKIDNIPSDKLPEYNRLFGNAGSAPAQAASASPSSAAPPAQAQAQAPGTAPAEATPADPNRRS